MSRRKGSLTAPPTEWCQLLTDTHHDLHTVRMLWRRGGGGYRPVIPDHINIDDLRDDRDWTGLELPTTHFEWVPEGAQDPVERREAIEEAVARLWTIAANWTRSRGDWCDFQLVGYGASGDLLFEDGRRCKVDDDDDDGTDWMPPPRDRAESSAQDSRESVERYVIQREHARSLKEILDYTKSDRDDAVDRANQTLENNHRLWAQANNAVRDAIEYQREQVTRTQEQQSGRIELKARALAEMEKTQRVARAIDFLKYGLDTAIANVLPFADRVVEVLGNRNLTVFPEFKCAQQAMAYLVLTLTVTQLDQLMDGNRKAGGAMLAVLDQGSKIKGEHEALTHVTQLIRILRSDLFRDVAIPEQQLAARYIIGRLAMYRMADYGEDQDAADGSG